MNVLLGNANGAGFYDAAQVQALHADTPLIQRDSESGQFTLGLEKATNLVDFTPIPFLAPNTTVNGDGKIEFLFTPSDDAAFYRLELGRGT